VCRANVESTDRAQRFRSHQYGVDVRGTGQKIAEADGSGREHMGGNALEHFGRTFNPPACHPEAEARAVTSGSTDEAGNSMRQRDIVVVKKDDEFAACRAEAEITRAGYAGAETSHHTKARIATKGVGVEFVTIVNNDQLDVPVCLGAQGG
jgi:hypothetical protein